MSLSLPTHEPRQASPGCDRLSIVAVRDALAAITDERRRLGASRRACELVADPEHRFRGECPN